MISGIQHGYAVASPTRSLPSDVSDQTRPTQDVPIATYAPVLMKFEQQARLLVTQFRNPENGELRVQYPAEAVVQAYSKQQSSEQQNSTEVRAPDVERDGDAEQTGVDSDGTPLGDSSSSWTEPETVAVTGEGEAMPAPAPDMTDTPAAPAVERVNVKA